MNKNTNSRVITIQRERRLPIPGQTLVSVGQMVEPHTPVASAKVPGGQAMVAISSRLDVDADMVPRYLKKQVGDSVEAGEALAATDDFLKMWRREALAPKGGVIESFDPRTSVMVIREPDILVERYAYLHGHVVEVLPGEGAIVEARVEAIYAAFGVGGERYGPLLVACGPDEVLTANHIRAEAKGAILLGGKGVTAAALQKADDLGVLGVITGGIQSNDLSQYLGYEMGVPITGQEEINTAILMTSGFGEQAMDGEIHDLLKDRAGSVVSINGSTHLRSSQIRPEILIPNLKPIN